MLVSFGPVEIGLCVAAFIALGGYFLGKSDEQDNLAEEWEGVVERVLIRDVVTAAHNSISNTAPIQEFTERLLYCKRDTGESEEFDLDPDALDYAELSSLEPGARITKAAGEARPRPAARTT